MHCHLKLHPISVECISAASLIVTLCLVFICTIDVLASTTTSPVPAAIGTSTGTAAVNQKHLDKQTVDAVNQIPGVQVKTSDMQAPDLKPIKGFHPIKRMLRPVENLESMSIRLQQQIMRLEGPIASLQQPMLALQRRMTNFEKMLGGMDKNLTGVNSQVAGVQQQINGAREEIKGVRSDLAEMREQIDSLKAPIQKLHEPISNVAEPLAGLDRRLVQVQGLIAGVLLMIVVSSIAIAVGTPIAAILIYRNRHKLFPQHKD